MNEIVPITQAPSFRRSGASNVAPPHLQAAFIEAARAAMGQPDEDEAMSFLGRLVTIVFNGDRQPITGRLTRIINHPSSAPHSTYLVLDNREDVRIPLNSIQSIKPAEAPELTEGS